MTDPISDFINRISNAGRAGLQSVRVPSSKMKKAIADLLVKRHFLAHVEEEAKDEKKDLIVHLRADRPPLQLKRVSRPGQRIYGNPKNMRRVKSGLGAAIFSTSKGILTDRDAAKQNIGGEILFTVY